MNGRFAISTAGHDAGEVYIIVGTQKDVVLLANGIGRTVLEPKKKNRKHIRVLEMEPDAEIKELLARGYGDETIRQAIHHLIKDNLRYK